MQTLVRPLTSTPQNYFVCGCPPLGLGSETNSSLSLATAVEFELRFRPYAQRIYRSALIVTKSPAQAKQLEREVCRKAWRSYAPMSATDFTRWLTRLLQQSFAELMIHS